MKHRESYPRVSPKLINYIKMIINQAPVRSHNTSERDYVERWHVNEIAFSARFVRRSKTPARLFRKLRAAWLWHHRAFVNLRIDGRAMPGENFVHLWRTGDTARRFRRQRTEADAYRVFANALAADWSTMCQKVLSIGHCLYRISRRCAGCAFSRRFFDKFEIDAGRYMMERIVICHDFSTFSVNVPIDGTTI